MLCLNLDPTLLELWKSTRGFLNSEFIAAFLSALAGAGLGVWGAQRIAERTLRRKELLEGLRQANALVVLSSTIANQALSSKKQHIAPLSKKYFEDQKVAEATNDILLKGGRPEKVFNFQAQLVKITPLTVPVEALKNLTYSAQLMPGKAIALVAMVEQSVTELSHVIGERSEQIERLRNQEMPPELLAQTYYGLKRRDGHTDAMYHDSMRAISLYTDDVAFFAAELTDELQAHAARLRQKLIKFTKDVPKANTVDFSESRKAGLMPPRQNYENWLSGFKSPD